MARVERDLCRPRSVVSGGSIHLNPAWHLVQLPVCHLKERLDCLARARPVGLVDNKRHSTPIQLFRQILAEKHVTLRANSAFRCRAFGAPNMKPLLIDIECVGFHAIGYINRVTRGPHKDDGRLLDRWCQYEQGPQRTNQAMGERRVGHANLFRVLEAVLQLFL